MVQLQCIENINADVIYVQLHIRHRELRRLNKERKRSLN